MGSLGPILGGSHPHPVASEKGKGPREKAGGEEKVCNRFFWLEMKKGDGPLRCAKADFGRGRSHGSPSGEFKVGAGPPRWRTAFGNTLRKKGGSKSQPRRGASSRREKRGLLSHPSKKQNSTDGQEGAKGRESKVLAELAVLLEARGRSTEEGGSALQRGGQGQKIEGALMPRSSKRGGEEVISDFRA